jgi:hypothetical protein
VGAGERRPQGRCSTKEGESDGSEGDGSKKMKRMGSNPPRLTLFIAGSTQSIRCGFLLRTKRPQRLYSEKSARRSRQIFRQQTKRHDLNPNLGRRPNKKTTSGRPDGKHDLQAPTSYKIRSLANHFAK